MYLVVLFVIFFNIVKVVIYIFSLSNFVLKMGQLMGRYKATDCRILRTYYQNDKGDYLYSVGITLTNSNNVNIRISYVLLLGGNIDTVRSFVRYGINPISLELKQEVIGFYFIINPGPYYIREGEGIKCDVNGVPILNIEYKTFCVLDCDEHNKCSFLQHDRPIDKYYRAVRKGILIPAELANGRFFVPEILPLIRVYKTEVLELNLFLK